MKKVFFVALFILFIAGGYVLGGKVSNYSIIPNNLLVPTPNKFASPTPSEDARIRDGERRELMLLQEKFLGDKPTSLRYGIEIPQFHKDWICSQPEYISNGFVVDCRQKDCSYTSSLPFPREIRIGEEDKKCTEELSKREYSRSLQYISIVASEYGSKKKITDFSTIMNSSKTVKTAKGRWYEFTKEPEEKYGGTYTAVFYSPYVLQYPSGWMSGDSTGESYIYGRYTIRMSVNGNDLSEEKIKKLIEKIIDTTVFTGTDEPENSGEFFY